MGQAQVLDHDGDLALARWGELLIALFAAPARASQIERVRAQLSQLGGRTAGTLVVIAPEVFAAPPEPAVRPATERLAREFPPRATAVVIEGDGLRAAAARLLVGALFRVSGGPDPRRTFSSVEEAAAWIAPLVAGEPGGPAALIASVAWLRAPKA